MKNFAAGKNKSGAGSMILGFTAGIAGNDIMIHFLEALLGEPLKWCLWAGMNPILPISVFGIAPLVHALSSVSIFLAFGSVLQVGGDGSEYMEPERIEWFYSLSKKEQNKLIDNNGDLSSDDDEDDSSEEERPKKKSQQEPVAMPEPTVVNP